MNKRLETYRHLSGKIAKISDDDLKRHLSTADLIHDGVGGRSYKAKIDNHLVFVKIISLTDLERTPKNFRSTANFFNLPLYYQYGVGSTGFGVWRELEALLTVTELVKSGISANFPLLFHWRILE